MNKALLLLLSMAFISCGAQLVDPAENSEDNPEKVELVRQNQRTVRYDCNGNVTSDKIETINSVSKRMRIDPQDTDALWGFSASAHGKTAGSISGSSGFFTVDIAPTVFHLRVYSGMNEVEYSFNYCDDQRTREVTDEEGNTYTERYCFHDPQVRERGSVFLDVDYRVEELEDIREIRPSDESCNEA